MVREALAKAIALKGSTRALGKASGYSQHGIWLAHKLGRVTPRMALAIERATEGKIAAERLCPEIFGRQARRQAA